MTAAPAAAPMICCLREELTGVSARLDITSLAILDSDGRELDDGEALERQDDPDLIFCAVRSTLLEVSQGRSALLLKLGARSRTVRVMTSLVRIPGGDDAPSGRSGLSPWPDAVTGASRIGHRFLRNIAYHESGHATCYRLTGMPVARVTIERVTIDGFTCEGFCWRTLEPVGGPSFEDLCGTLHEMKLPLFDDRAEIAGELLTLHYRTVATLSGPIAEALFTTGPMLPNVDADNARALAEVIVRSPAAVDAYLAYAAAEGRALLLNHRDIVVALAQALMRRRTLTGTEVDQIASSASPREGR